jgi:hypothetical protein
MVQKLTVVKNAHRGPDSRSLRSAASNSAQEPMASSEA